MAPWGLEAQVLPLCSDLFFAKKFKELVPDLVLGFRGRNRTANCFAFYSTLAALKGGDNTMSLIYDSFPTLAKAQGFQRAAEKRFPQRRTRIWMSQEDMESWFTRMLNREVPFDIECDCFPWQLYAPIVLVSRLEDGDHAHWDALQTLVKNFGGTFVGT
jgi:hypothetical protein